MKTRERILDTALLLFNQQGTSPISTNHIADALGISPGNLYYYFRNKEEIIRALFERLFTVWDSAFQLPDDQILTLDDLKELVRKNFSISAEYGFIYREQIALLQRDTPLQQRWVTIRTRGFEGFRRLVAHFAAAGVIHIPDDPDQLTRLAEICWLISEFWLPSIEVRGERVNDEQLNNGVALLMQVIQPFIVVTDAPETSM